MKMDDLDPQELIDESGLVFDVKFDPNNGSSTDNSF